MIRTARHLFPIGILLITSCGRTVEPSPRSIIDCKPAKAINSNSFDYTDISVEYDENGVPVALERKTQTTDFGDRVFMDSYQPVYEEGILVGMVVIRDGQVQKKQWGIEYDENGRVNYVARFGRRAVFYFDKKDRVSTKLVDPGLTEISDYHHSSDGWEITKTFKDSDFTEFYHWDYGPENPLYRKDITLMLCVLFMEDVRWDPIDFYSMPYFPQGIGRDHWSYEINSEGCPTKMSYSNGNNYEFQYE